MYNTRLVTAQIDLDALAFNLRAIRSFIKPQTKILGVVKANAYGHGAVEIAKELEIQKADMLGVACIYEVAQLRAAKIKLPILNFGALLVQDVEAVFEYDFIPTIFSLEIAKSISELAVKKNKIVDIHVKINTGLNRVGVEMVEAAKLITDIKKLPNINIAGLYTHFACAEYLDSDATKIQLKNFNKIIAELKNLQIEIPLIHAANSGATLFWPETHFNMVRVGILLYGCNPDPKLKLPIAIKPVMTLKTNIAHIKTVPENTPISYGWTYLTTQTSQIATLSVGYGDGFRRTPKNWGSVLVKGKKVPVVGIVCMDQSMVDTTAISGLKVGDEAVLIGAQGEGEINVWDVAKQLETSAYEIFCGVTARVNRVYIKNGK